MNVTFPGLRLKITIDNALAYTFDTCTHIANVIQITYCICWDLGGEPFSHNSAAPDHMYEFPISEQQ